MLDEPTTGCPITVLLYFNEQHLDLSFWLSAYSVGIYCGLVSGWLGIGLARLTWRRS